MSDGYDYPVAPAVVSHISVAIKYDDGSSTTLNLDPPWCQELKQVLTTMCLALSLADFGYVESLTANCLNGTKHTGS